MQDKTDEELAELVQGGDKQAFALLVIRYEKKLLRYGSKFLFYQENIQDTVQDIFIKAYINIKSFDVSKKFSPWIYRIAHNEFINIIRKKKKEPILFFNADTIFSFKDKKEDLLLDFDKNQERKEIEKYLKKLDIKYREPIILYYFEDKSYEEISDILGIPTSTVGIRLKRARQKIKEKYEKRK